MPKEGHFDADENEDREMGRRMTKLKEGHVIEYRTVLGDRVISVVSGPYTSATGHECVELRNGLPIRSDMCKIIGFECPHCGRKYEEEPWECTSEED